MIYNCPSRIQQALQLFFVIPDLFRASLIQMEAVCDAVLDFQICFLFSLFTLWFSLLLKVNQKKYESAESEETKKNKKIFIVTKNL